MERDFRKLTITTELGNQNLTLIRAILENNNFPAKIIGQRSISASSADMTGASTITCVDVAAGISQTDQYYCVTPESYVWY